MIKKNKIPDFFIIGAPKTGTTSLANYLGQHEDIFFSDPKEPEYFAVNFNRRPISNIDNYLKLFNKIDSKDNILIGEGSVNYYYDINSIKNILSYNPNAKFIFMLRKPIDLVQSLHSQLVFQGEENILDFELAWKMINERKKGNKIPFLCRDSKWLFYSEWGKLGNRLENLLTVIDKDSLKIIFFEDFINNTSQIFDEVLHFLNLKNKNKIIFSTLNKRKQIKSLYIQKMVHLMGDISMKLQNFFGIKFKFGIANFIKKINTRTSINKKINKNFRLELELFFKEDIKKLSELTGVDLKHWYTK